MSDTLSEVERMQMRDAYEAEMADMSLQLSDAIAALDDAREVIGYVVWDKKLHTIYRGRVYSMLPDAEKVRANIVWHSRERYEVRGVVLS